MFDLYYSEIEKYETICIYRHVAPDGDAYGSQFGLATFLKQLYPNKKIYCLGNHKDRNYGVFPEPDEVSDEMIENSLSIVCDTSTIDRIDDKRALNAKQILKFDHHDGSEKYANYEIVLPDRASCCELVAEFIDYKQKLETVDKKIAEYLYLGIFTDTLSFTTTNCTYDSFEIASKLIKAGVVANEIDYIVHKQSTELYNLISKFRTKMIFTDNHLGYAYLTNAEREEYHQTYTQCKDMVNEFGKVEGLLVWVLLSEEEEKPGTWNASLRSRKVVINTIANKYGGGGHKNAAGADCLSEEQVNNLLKDLDQAITETLKDGQ